MEAKINDILNEEVLEVAEEFVPVNGNGLKKALIAGGVLVVVGGLGYITYKKVIKPKRDKVKAEKEVAYEGDDTVELVEDVEEVSKKNKTK